MFGLSKRKDLERVDQLSDPRHAEPWFHELEPKRRREMTAEWRQDLAQSLAVRRAERRRVLSEVLGAGALFSVLDAFFNMYATSWTALVMTVFGLAAGVVWIELDTTRLSTPVVTMIAFLAGVIVSRGGISPQHFFIAFLAGGVAFWIGVRREEGWQ